MTGNKLAPWHRPSTIQRLPGARHQVVPTIEFNFRSSAELKRKAWNSFVEGKGHDRHKALLNPILRIPAAYLA